MSQVARRREEEEAIPTSVSHDEKTIETVAIPELVLTDEITVPVQTSLEKILRHEMLRHRSRSDEER